MSVVPKHETLLTVATEKIPRSLTVLLVVMFVVAAWVTGVIVVFGYLQLHHGVFRTLARYAPFPAMVVDGHVVWYREVSERANALEVLTGLDAEAAVAQATTLAVRHRALLALADQLGVSVPESEREAFVASDEVLTVLRTQAVWTERQYVRWGAASYVFAQKVEVAGLHDATVQAEARARVVRVQEKRRQGIPFYNLAVQYSDGQTAAQGGDAGYVDPATLPAALAAWAATAVNEDESDILETDTSFWLLRAEDVIDSGDGRLVWLRVIEQKKDLLAALLATYVDDMTVVQFLW